jgi:hypothetical protein
MIYLCRSCDAYVGVHKGTDIPLGRLANKELRRWKNTAHSHFDRLWKDGDMTRGEAYYWLSRRMKLPEDKTHIGMFDLEQCKKVVSIMLNYERRQNYGPQDY